MRRSPSTAACSAGTFDDAAPPEAPVRYVVASLGGRDVAALTGPDDAAGDLEHLRRGRRLRRDRRHAAGAGRHRRVEPADAGPDGRAGRSATVLDPEGAPIGLWQPRQRLGVQAANEPGAWNFSDLHTGDPARPRELLLRRLRLAVVDQGWGTAIQVPGYGDHLEATVDPDIRTRQASAPEGFEDVIGGIAPLKASGSSRTGTSRSPSPTATRRWRRSSGSAASCSPRPRTTGPATPSCAIPPARSSR